MGVIPQTLTFLSTPIWKMRYVFTRLSRMNCRAGRKKDRGDIEFLSNISPPRASSRLRFDGGPLLVNKSQKDDG